MLVARWERTVAVGASGLLGAVHAYWPVVLVNAGATRAIAGVPIAPHWVTVPLAAKVVAGDLRSSFD